MLILYREVICPERIKISIWNKMSLLEYIFLYRRMISYISFFFFCFLFLQKFFMVADNIISKAGLPVFFNA